MLCDATTSIVDLEVRRTVLNADHQVVLLAYSVQSAIQDLANKNERDMCTLVSAWTEKLLLHWTFADDSGA